MNRPEVVFDPIDVEAHADAIYQFYSEEYRPNPPTTAFLYRALATVFKPEVTYISDAQNKIETMLDEERTLVLASNHIHAEDPCNLAAFVQRERTFAPLITNSFIPSKPGLFKFAPVRYAVDGLGAIPVFRDKDIKKENKKRDKKGIDPLTLRTINEINNLFMDACIARLDKGQNMAIFAEGTRNKGDTTKLQPLFSGVGEIVTSVTKVVQPAIVPVALRYTGSIRKPKVFIGEPSKEPFKDRKDTMAWLTPSLRACVEFSIKHAA